VSSASQFCELSPAQQCLSAGAGVEPRWYAIHTRAQHEKSVTSHLQSQGITTYLPLVAEVHRWSDRQKVVQMPLFSCYVFVHMPLVPETWASVMRINSVLRFVGTRSEGVPIPENQIESTRTLLDSKVPYAAHPFLKIGQRVRVRGGSLDGIEGILTARNGNHTLVISVEPVQRSLAVCIDGYCVEPV
jgi:transcription termination/antitermination protein NusG